MEEILARFGATNLGGGTGPLGGGYGPGALGGANTAPEEGSADAVNEMIDFCSQGPEMARVDRIEVVEENPENLDSFQIR